MFPVGLIVSSQALAGNPLRCSEYLAVMAEAAASAGAAAIRANGVSDITEIRKRVQVPIIGIDKQTDDTGRTVITPNFEGAKAIAAAGATIIALDATGYPSSLNEDRKELIRRIHEELHLMVLADISTAEEAYRAAEMGADAVSTTLSGYMPHAKHTEEELYIPDFQLIREIAAMHLPCRLAAEGRIWTREDLKRAFDLGADAAIIGKAITNPQAITRYFLSAVPESLQNGKKTAPPPPASTEDVNPNTKGISDADIPEILDMLHTEDAAVSSAVRHCLPQLSALAEKGVEVMKAGGRILYCGCGTSGRLAVADAAECPPTFGLEKDRISAVMCGGEKAVFSAAESCEDSKEAGEQAAEDHGCQSGDLVIGISASGQAPFVCGFLEKAKQRGCTTACIVNNQNTKLAALSDFRVEALTGPEAIKGSTRLKAGSAQKMILNLFSTTVCIKMGFTCRNYMVNMKPINRKLQNRAVSMVSDITGASQEEAAAALQNRNWNIRSAIEALTPAKEEHS